MVNGSNSSCLFPFELARLRIGIHVVAAGIHSFVTSRGLDIEVYGAFMCIC